MQNDFEAASPVSSLGIIANYLIFPNIKTEDNCWFVEFFVYPLYLNANDVNPSIKHVK